jgi:hypothetical protein
MRAGKVAERGKAEILANWFQYSTTELVLEGAHGVYTEVFLTPPGKDPVEGGKVAATTTKGIWKGFNQIAIGKISIQKTKNEPEGDDEFVTTYNLRVEGGPAGPQPIVGRNDANPSETVYIGSTGRSVSFTKQFLQIFSVFTIEDFLVTEITIRNHTVDEIWAAIGGVYAGCVLIISILFTASGKFNENGDEVQIFRFLPGSIQQEWLAPYEDDDNKTSEEVVNSPVNVPATT